MSVIKHLTRMSKIKFVLTWDYGGGLFKFNAVAIKQL